MHIFAAVILAAIAFSASAEEAPPAPGADVDQTRAVRLQETLPSPCAEVSLESISVVLPLSEIQALADALPLKWTTESERMQLVRGKRAASLLEALSSQTGRADCAGRVDGASGADWMSLVLDFIQDGRAAVLIDKRGLAEFVYIRYLGMRCGPLCGRGDIHVSIPGALRPFLVVHWWSS